jgi:bifunctional ADP-heptose synthase (sugar kinase/adenylyltransferase)
LNPKENLKTIHEQFPNAKIVLVYGSNWRKVPGAEYLKRINGTVVKFPFYDKLSTENVIKKIFNNYKTEAKK